MPLTRDKVPQARQLLDQFRDQRDAMSAEDGDAFDALEAEVERWTNPSGGLYLTPRSEGDAVSGIERRSTQPQERAFGDPNAEEDPSLGEQLGTAAKRVPVGVARAFGVPTSREELAAEGSPQRIAENLALGPFRPTLDVIRGHVQQADRVRATPSSQPGRRAARIAGAVVPLVGPMLEPALEDIAQPGVDIAQGRTPRPETQRRAARAGGETIGMLVAPKIAEASLRGIGKIATKAQSAAVRGADVSAPNRVNRVLALGNKQAIREAIGRGDNPGRAMLEEFPEFPNDVAQGEQLVRSRMDEIHQGLSDTLNTDYADVRADRRQVMRALIEPAVRDAANARAEGLTSPSMDIARKRVEWVKNRYGTLDLSAAQLNDLKAKLYQQIKKFGELSDADRSVNALRRRQAQNLRHLLDDITQDPQTGRSAITDANRRYGELADAADALSDYKVKQDLGEIHPQRTLRGRASAAGAGAAIGWSLGGPLAGTLGAFVGDALEARTQGAMQTPRFAIRSGQVQRALADRVRPAPPIVERAPVEPPRTVGAPDWNAPQISPPSVARRALTAGEKAPSGQVVADAPTRRVGTRLGRFASEDADVFAPQSPAPVEPPRVPEPHVYEGEIVDNGPSAPPVSSRPVPVRPLRALPPARPVTTFAVTPDGTVAPPGVQASGAAQAARAYGERGPSTTGAPRERYADVAGLSRDELIARMDRLRSEPPSSQTLLHDLTAETYDAHVTSRDSTPLARAAKRLRSDIVGVMRGKSDQVSPMFRQGSHPDVLADGRALYEKWQPLRDALRREHGDAVTLYRADAPTTTHVPDQTVLRYADSPEWIKERGYDEGGRRAITAYQIPVDDIVAAPTMTIDKYEKDGYLVFTGDIDEPRYTEYVVLNRKSPQLRAPGETGAATTVATATTAAETTPRGYGEPQSRAPRVRSRAPRSESESKPEGDVERQAARLEAEAISAFRKADRAYGLDDLAEGRRFEREGERLQTEADALRERHGGGVREDLERADRTIEKSRQVLQDIHTTSTSALPRELKMSATSRSPQEAAAAARAAGAAETREMVTFKDVTGRRYTGHIMRRFPSKNGPAVSVATDRGERMVLEKDLQYLRGPAGKSGKQSGGKK